MSDELEPLGPLALRALAAEQKRGAVDSALQERLLARVVATVAVGAVATAAASTAAASTGTAAGAGAGASAGAAATGLTLKALPWIIAAFVAGGGAGAAIHAAVAPAPSSPLHPSLETSAPEPARSLPPLPLPLPPPPMPSDVVPSTPVGSLPAAPATMTAPRPSASAAASVAPVTSGGSDVDLASERALVDRARTAIRLGQSSDALAALDAHAAKFPRGRLSEEREALAVDALARSGRADEARARAARFKAAYPNSVFGAVVDAATGAH